MVGELTFIIFGNIRYCDIINKGIITKLYEINNDVL